MEEPQVQMVKEPPGLPDRPVDGHKGTFGRVLVVGGSRGMIGAPVLAGTAALRMGSGLVQIAVPKSILNAAISITPELIGIGLNRSTWKEHLLRAADAADVIVVGPGMGQGPEATERLLQLVRFDRPMVVDADGLNLLAKRRTWPTFFTARAVLTPHPGEMARLARMLGRSDVPAEDEGRLRLAAEAARALGQVVVLKGHRTVVTDGLRAYVNHTGDSTLAKAGSGDILSGMIGSLLGQGMCGFEAGALGVWLHGRAGEIAGQRVGQRSALARDVAAAIGEAISER